jgi:hypothetical protein
MNPTLNPGRQTPLLTALEQLAQGIPHASLTPILAHGGGSGVGISGMPERIEQLGGHLEIASAGRGTTVRARLPPAG